MNNTFDYMAYIFKELRNGVKFRKTKPDIKKGESSKFDSEL